MELPPFEKDIKTNYLEKKDDYNFIECNVRDTRNIITDIAKRCIDKGLNENNIQVLAPMYKGEIGIDNLNINKKNEDDILTDEEKYRIGSMARCDSASYLTQLLAKFEQSTAQ